MQFNEFETGFLTCFIETDGAVGVVRSKDKRAKLGFYLTPYISFVNTPRQLISAVKKMLDLDSPKIVYDKTNNVHRLLVRATSVVLGILNLLTPHLIDKQDRAKLVIEYCESRLQHMQKPYNQREIDIFNRLRKLNG